MFDKSPSKHGTLDDLSQIYAHQLLLKNSIRLTQISKAVKTLRDAHNDLYKTYSPQSTRGPTTITQYLAMRLI